MNDCRGMFEVEIINTILESRGIIDKERFLNPSEQDLIPFEEMHNIDAARDIVAGGIENDKQFMVYFDTDTDGCTAGAIMYRYLKNFTDKIFWTINEGKAHGLTIDNEFDELFKNVDILIIVDSLNKDLEPYEKLKAMGIEVVVLDHHDITNNDVFNIVTLVSSVNDYPNPQLSGAGVVWKFCAYLDDYFLSDYAKDLVDLATCGIIADMCDVSEASMENRYICSLGFKNQVNPAIKKINGSFPFDSQSISYGIAPLINAACRVKENTTAALAFILNENKDILSHVKALKSFKEQQNISIDEIYPEIIEQADSQLQYKAIYIIIDTEADVSGLLGNKLLEKYQRPMFILRQKNSADEDGVISNEKYSGSCRAIGVEDFRFICESTGLCFAEGHPSAFGFSINAENYEEFKNQIETILLDIEFSIDVNIDIKLDLEDISSFLIDKIKYINKISGTGFPPITALISDVKNYTIGFMSEGKHLKIITPEFDFIKWNFSGDPDIFDNDIYSPSIEFIGKLDSGYFGREFRCRQIIDDYIIHDGLESYGEI